MSVFLVVIGCEGIDPPPIVRPAGRPVKRRIKDHVDMIIGNKVRKTCQVTCSKYGEKGHYYKTCKGAPRDPNWKTKSRKTKKVNTQVATEGEAIDGQSEVPTSQNPSNNAPNAQNTPMDLVEKSRKSKKKKPKMTTMPQHEEMTLSQIAPTPPNAAPSQEPSVTPPLYPPPPPPPPPPTFKMKQPVVRAPNSTPTAANREDAQGFTFMPTPGFNPPKNI
ncbi:hypothetical protein PIB30_079424 [Stylosanthes scabra]|uniref:CCHC-type domain-containing protein n=1 Tax=Stylosanthes scabra TaxID=79078 RepID=A0ABU6ZPV9_9FABA|nr:hypothetical protein [Stylosanthes scabra]